MEKLILFDLDGTLLLSGGCGKDALDSAMENLFKKRPSYDLSFLAGCTDARNFPAVFELTMGRKIKPAELKKLKEEYFRILEGSVKKSCKNKKYHPIKGVEKFLKFLASQKNVYLALGTGNYEKSAAIKLKPSGMDKYFKTGGYGEDSHYRPDMLKKGVERAEKYFKKKFKPSQVYIIGDTEADIISAKECGYHSAVVLTGHGDRKKILRAAAELETDDFTDTASWLVWLDLKKDPKGVKKGQYILPASPIEHVFFSRTGIDEDRLKMLRIKKYSDLPSGKIF